MAGKSDSKNNPRSKQLRSSPKPPVVLVPETPPPLDEVPIATEDEATPTLATPPSLSSYASVAALPAARSNVVVWPRNPAVVPSAPNTPLLGQRKLGSEETAMGCGHQEEVSRISSSSLPSSSPIHFTSSATATPTPETTTSDVHITPLAAGTATSHAVDSYEEFWKQVRTPMLSETNMPSALHTPRILSSQTASNATETPWLASIPTTHATLDLGTTEVENRPPRPDDAGSHPPVASRMRKRRRGRSPVSGERVRKSARRKGKERAGPTPRESADVFGQGQENPWATGSARPTTRTEAHDEAPPLPFRPPQFLFTANQTPYDDFRRSGSANTSFYNRLNESGSYPTPHRLSDSPTPAKTDAMSTNSRLPSSLPPSSAPSASTRGRSSTTSSHSMEMDWVAGGLQSRDSTTPSFREHPRSPATADDADGRHEEASSDELRRRLRNILSDPRSSSDERHVYRSPTVEDLPEEGELQGTRSLRRVSNARSETAGGFYRQNGYAPPPRQEHSWRDQDATLSSSSLLSQRESSTYSPQRSSTRGYEEERSSRAYGSNTRDITPTQRSASRYQSIPPFPPQLDPRQEQRPSDHRPRQMSLPNANRINNLGVFDVGDDDNLPDAVRRGGTTQEGEEETPTPIPFEGDPEVHRHDPEAHLRGLSDTWVQEVWADPMNTSITLNTFNPRFSRSYGTNRRTASDLRRFISQITGEASFLVIAPDQAPDHRGRGPVEWAITGLSSGGVDCLLRRRVWSFKSITFFPRRRSLDNPRWILALEGFLEDNVRNIEAAVRSTFERPQVRQRIIQMIQANPEFNAIPTEEAFRRIMATLRVTVFTLDNETVVANVFLRSPTQSIRVWRRWIQELRDLTFGSYHTAIARVRRISSCVGCLGVDHPSHLCPFPRLQNWNGPEAAGGTSYSVDGRERRSRQQSDAPQGPPEPYNRLRRQRNLPFDADAARAGPSRSRSENTDGEWDDRARGRDGAHDNGQRRNREQGWRGPARRGKKESSGTQKYGRDRYRKDGGR